MIQNLQGIAKAVLREQFISNRIISQKTRKISNKQPNLTPKATRERRTNKSQISKRKETIKIRAEINEIETKETMEKIITNEATHKGLISEYTRAHAAQYQKNNPMKNWAEDLHTGGQQTHEKMLNITIF